MKRPWLYVLLLAFFIGGCGSSPGVSQAPSKAEKVVVAQVSQAKTMTDFGNAKYMGDKICANCHKDATEHYKKTLMGKTLDAPARPGVQKVDCESCHGPASEHVMAGGGRGKGIKVTFRPGVEPAAVQNKACLNCHQNGDRKFWASSPHASRDVTCVSCHTIMRKVSDRYQLAKKDANETCATCHIAQKAKFFRAAHMGGRDGTVQCSSCHRPHGSPTEKLLKGNSINENCYNCHPEKRGPVLWEHPPVRENCANCHEPHGTLNDNLLKIRLPRLCNACHEGRHPSTPEEAQSRYVFNRGCLNCHSQIHGSNHPSGKFFLR